jgi:hypothetical protein
MSDGSGKLNLAALGVAATGLVTVLGGLSATGEVGRVLRNDPQPLAWALCAVLVGAALNLRPLTQPCPTDQCKPARPASVRLLACPSATSSGR